MWWFDKTIRTTPPPGAFLIEAPNYIRGMGFEPMRIAPTDLETVSLTTRTSSLGRGCDLVLVALGHPLDTLSGNRTRVSTLEV